MACSWMTRTVQVKGVPEDVHRTLKARAASRGQTLSDYLRAEMQRLAVRPSADELSALLDRDAPAALGDSAAPEVRRGRHRDDIVPASAGTENDRLRQLVAEGRVTPPARARPRRPPAPAKTRRGASSTVLSERDSER